MKPFKPVSVILPNDYSQSDKDGMDKTFQDLLMACRSGDLERVESLVRNYSAPINKTDFWQCSPLYLACLCGHYKVVSFLLENGARCERDTFEGERCYYGALTSEIRQLLHDYKFSKAVDESQPYFKFLATLYDRPLNTFSDVIFKLKTLTFDEEIHAHRCILYARSKYFGNKLETIWRNYEVIEIRDPQWHPTCFRIILRYLYTSEIITVDKDLGSKMITMCRQFELYNLAERYNIDNKILKKEVQEFDKLESQGLRRDFENFFRNIVLNNKKSLDDITGNSDTNSNNSGTSIFAQADICIQIGRQIFPCHKAFLTERSEYLNILITGPFAESQQMDTFEQDDRLIPKIKILDDCTADVFALILEFIYTDKCDIPPTLSHKVLIEADKFLLDKLKSLASIVLTNQLEPLEDIYMLMRAALDLN
ncbi:6626_t:CDS:2, partial [Scutellospora calospora]